MSGNANAPARRPAARGVTTSPSRVGRSASARASTSTESASGAGSSSSWTAGPKRSGSSENEVVALGAARFRAGKRLWNPEEDDLLRRTYPDLPTAAIAPRLRRTLCAVNARATKLGLEKSVAYLASPAACRLRRGDQIGAPWRYQKGHVPANKGLRRPGWAVGRMKETQFKRGVRQGIAVKLWKPIGTERISKDGYRERKINNDLPLQRRWRAVHLILWESVNGPVPPGHAIAFKDGDKTHISLENLECITRRELMARNTIHNLPEPLAQTIQLLGALNRQIRTRNTHAQEKQDRRSTRSPLRNAGSTAGRGEADGARSRSRRR